MELQAALDQNIRFLLVEVEEPVTSRQLDVGLGRFRFPREVLLG